jgi:hypothetical protein
MPTRGEQLRSGRCSADSGTSAIVRSTVAASRVPWRERRPATVEALHFLYAAYVHNVYGNVCSLVQDEHEAGDVTPSACS